MQKQEISLRFVIEGPILTHWFSLKITYPLRNWNVGSNPRWPCHYEACFTNRSMNDREQISTYNYKSFGRSTDEEKQFKTEMAQVCHVMSQWNIDYDNEVVVSRALRTFLMVFQQTYCFNRDIFTHLYCKTCSFLGNTVPHCRIKIKKGDEKTSIDLTGMGGHPCHYKILVAGFSLRF